MICDYISTFRFCNAADEHMECVLQAYSKFVIKLHVSFHQLTTHFTIFPSIHNGLLHFSQSRIQGFFEPLPNAFPIESLPATYDQGKSPYLLQKQQSVHIDSRVSSINNNNQGSPHANLPIEIVHDRSHKSPVTCHSTGKVFAAHRHAENEEQLASRLKNWK